MNQLITMLLFALFTILGAVSLIAAFTPIGGAHFMFLAAAFIILAFRIA